MYAELQVTTNYSFLRGGSHPGELVLRAAELGHAAIGIADRHSLAGVVRAHVAAKEAGLRLLVGARIDSRDGHSLLLYPTDRAAYGRLSRLLTLGNRRTTKGDCALWQADLEAHAEGQIAVVLAPRHPARPPFADRLAALAAIYPGRCYLAASALFRGNDAQRLALLDGLARRHGTPLLATNDVHYHAPERRALQDVLTAIREGCTVEQAGYRLFANAERHLKPPQEMARLFRRYPGALRSSLDIVERCRFSLDELKYEYPVAGDYEGRTPQQELERLTWLGATEHFPDGVPDHIRTTILHELELVQELNYAPYFLTVQEIVAFARSQDILCQGRGSAANSVVCFCLGITAVDPTQVDVLFERFISASRNEPPDIDVDFEHERREEVIQHIYQTYGRERAGLAATVIYYRSRSAIREVGKVLGLSPDTVGILANTVWGSGSGAIDPTHVQAAGLDPADRRLALALDLAGTLCGFPRHLSQHVGGFVIAAGRLDELAPIQNAAMQDRTVVEWDKDDLDALGILKIDVLALGMLTCLRKGLDLLEKHYDLRLSLATLPREDPAVYEMLCRADSLGVFQVESRAQMSMLPRLRPREFYDLVIEVAIVRPGPIQGDMVHPYLRRRSGDEAVSFPSRELEQVLGKTLGVPLFQEQAMKIAIVAAGFTPGEADRLRRAMATFRHVGTIYNFRDKMIEGMVARNYERDFAERCFAQIEGFGSYGFPESHAASFALLVYASSWLKCHYPATFACALLNSQPMGFYAPAQIVRDAREHGVIVLPPDVNRSDWDCTLEEVPSPSPPAAIEGNGAFFPSPPAQRGETEGPAPSAAWEGEVGVRARGNRAGDLLSDRASRAAEPPSLTTPPSSRSDTLLSHPRDDARVPPLLPPQRMGGEGKTAIALRLGLRQVSGANEAEMKHMLTRRDAGYRSVGELWRRGGLSRAQIEVLARADAFGSLDLARRDVLWAARGLAENDLPLFAFAQMAEISGEVLTGGDALPSHPRVPAGNNAPAPPPQTMGGEGMDNEPAVTLPAMGLGEAVVDDYHALQMSLRSHPLALLRSRLGAGITPSGGLSDWPLERKVTVCGLVLVRQRPGSASGTVFITLEDETGITNAIVWPAVFERFRLQIMAARMLRITGLLQREGNPNDGQVIHVVAEHVLDCSELLDEVIAIDAVKAEPLPQPLVPDGSRRRRGNENYRPPVSPAQRRRPAVAVPVPTAPADHLKSGGSPDSRERPPRLPMRLGSDLEDTPRKQRPLKIRSRDFH